jgi:hypothetical protein
MSEVNERPNLGAHYRQGGIETWDYIVAQGMDYLQGNVVKYVTRFRRKDGMKDLEKAKHYLDKLISVERERGLK